MSHNDGRWDGGWRSLSGAWEEVSRGEGGVYELRATDREGRVRRIPRLRRDDPEGILYVGHSKTRLAGRIEDFFACASRRRRSGHVAGVRYAQFQFDAEIALTAIQIRWRYLPPDRAKPEERRLLREYQARYLDLPPLNHNG